MHRKFSRFCVTVVALLILFCMYAVPICSAETVPGNYETPSQQTSTVETQVQPEPVTQQGSQQTTSSQPSQPVQFDAPAVDMSSGIPAVTTEQAVDKVNGIINELYQLIMRVAPMITILVLLIGGLLMFVYKPARAAIGWAILGLILVVCAVPIVGYIGYIIRLAVQG